MQMHRKNLSTGEFSRLCKTTKATLFHYEKLGLLKPKNVLGNGYRRYGIEQFFDFDTIAILKETGSSLEEIMQMRDNLDEEKLLKLLEEKKHTLRKERKRLESRETMLGNILDDLREARNLALDRFMVQEMDEEFLKISPVSGDNQENLAESALSYAAYINSDDDNTALRAPFGIILEESVLSGAPYRELFYFSRSGPSTMEKLCKPSGKYLVVAHRGSFISHLNCLKNIGKWCSEHKYNVCGRIYAYDLANFLRPVAIEDYLIKYIIPVTAILE